MKVIRFIIFLAIMALWPTIARAGAGDGLLGTAHDFSGTSVTAGNGETMTTGLCTFCHTPHKALSTLLLWNHTLSTNTFSWDVSSTTAGTTFPTFAGDTYKGPTAKCLSCHDGSVAIGDVAWFGEGAANLDTRKMSDPARQSHQIGPSGAMKGNHPVAMPYPYLNAANTYNGVTTGGGAVLTEWQATPLSPIRVFSDDGTGNITGGVAVAAKTGIECSSCHDPHNKASVDDMFLRGTIGGSAAGTGANYLCLKCHVK